MASDHPAYQHGEATRTARARTAWINRLGRALMKLERARTPAETEKAIAFAGM